MGVDRYRVCELWAAGPDVAGSGSGYRLGDRLVLTARHVIAPALAGPGGKLRVRPLGVTEWLPARLWQAEPGDPDSMSPPPSRTCASSPNSASAQDADEWLAQIATRSGSRTACG